MRRRVLAIAIALAAGSAPAAAQAPAPTKTPGELVVGLSMPAAGFQVGAVLGRDVLFAKGYEIDLADAIAKQLGVPKVRFVNEDRFTALLAAGPHDWDLALSQLTIRADRAQRVDFSTPYFRADQGVLLRRGLQLKSRTFRALRKLKLCAERGSTGAEAARDRIAPTRKLRLVGNLSRLQADLYQRRCDAVVADAPQLGVMRAQAPDRFGKLAGRIATGEEYGAAFQRGSRLRPLVDDAIAALAADGTLAQLAKTWLSTDVESLKRFR
jgi:polar amino acid transport system substrate-binding protein